MPPGFPQRVLLLVGEYERRMKRLLPGFVLGYSLADALGRYPTAVTQLSVTRALKYSSVNVSHRIARQLNRVRPN
jgi:hypothetical protein